VTEVPKTGKEPVRRKMGMERANRRNSVSVPAGTGGRDGVATNLAFRQCRDGPSKAIGAGALGTMKMEHAAKKCLERR